MKLDERSSHESASSSSIPPIEDSLLLARFKICSCFNGANKHTFEMLLFERSNITRPVQSLRHPRSNIPKDERFSVKIQLTSNSFVAFFKYCFVIFAIVPTNKKMRNSLYVLFYEFN